MALNYDILDTIGQYMKPEENEQLKAVCDVCEIPHEAVPQIEKNEKENNKIIVQACINIPFSFNISHGKEQRINDIIRGSFVEVQNDIINATSKNITLTIDEVRRTIIRNFLSYTDKHRHQEKINAKIFIYILKHSFFHLFGDNSYCVPYKKKLLFEYFLKCINEYLYDFIEIGKFEKPEGSKCWFS